MSQVYSTEPSTSGHVILDTTHGPIDIHLWCKECPTTTRSFLQLCLDGYYNNMIFHRILSDFLIQTGLYSSSSSSSSSINTNNKNTPLEQNCIVDSISMDRYLRSSSAALSGGVTGGGGDALGLDRKKLEVNPRIRFNHRGQVAMAFPLDEKTIKHNDDDYDGTNVHGRNNVEVEEETAMMLRYQFFITLNEAPFLDAKHVVFGTVVGPTMFNALRIGRTDADEHSGMPIDIMDSPPRIINVRVNYHPFDDLVTSSEDKIPWKIKIKKNKNELDGEKQQSAIEIRRKKRKGKRDYNVLSFGDEERFYEEENTVASSNRKSDAMMLSSHEALAVTDDRQVQHPDPVTSKDTDKILLFNEDRKNGNELKQKEAASHGSGSQCLVEDEPREHSNEAKTNEKIRKEHAKISGVSAVEARRAKYLKSGIGSSANKGERLKRENDTMARLSVFKSKVIETTKGRENHDEDNMLVRHPQDNSIAARMAYRAEKMKKDEDLRKEKEDAFIALPGYSGKVFADEANSGNDDNTWMGTQFKCRRHIDNDSRTLAMDKTDEDEIGGDGRRMEDYVVFDDKSGRQQGHRRNVGTHSQNNNHRSKKH